MTMKFTEFAAGGTVTVEPVGDSPPDFSVINAAAGIRKPDGFTVK